MNYLSLSEGKLDRVEWNGCKMQESLWADIRMLKVAFRQCDLMRAQWIRTPLQGVDMSTCSVSGWTISLQDLRGMRVAPAQAVELCGLLGVEIIS